jgi:Tol biopolymer transport system component
MYQDPADGDFELYRVRPDGSDQRQVTHNYYGDFWPDWK